MKFSSGALVVALGATPLISGFIPTTDVLVKQVQTTSAFGVINTKIHNSKYDSRHCNSKLFMSEESVAVDEETTEEVPAEVAAIDGIADETEAHNVERPARGSGIKKHNKGEKSGKALSEFTVGDSVEGTVKATTSYGAFLNIGATTDALLHVSRMSDDFVSNVEDVVKVGDVVTVRIANIDAEKNQVALTMRSQEAEDAAASKAQEGRGGGARRQRPKRSDGDREAQRASMSKLAAGGYSDDTFVEGEVVSMLDFGAFVRFDSSQFGDNFSGEIDGLVHISALSPDRVESVQSVVSVGEKVQIRVKNVDAENGKVSLSMISKEDEKSAPPRKQRGGGVRSPWSEKEMGAKDWKEQMDRVLAEQGEFKNMPVIVDKRK